jgi:ABC-type multidrug transport system ATPase subunit
MIKVENLTKKYAGQTAIRDLNFEVGQGEIMGFLGPNGAGKTTTMRILASFLPATSGRASIAGFDVFEQSLQARAHLGYMPGECAALQRHASQRVLELSRGVEKHSASDVSANAWAM